MTLAEYRAAIREDLDDTEYSASVIDRAINDYMKEIASRSKMRKLETSDELFISAGDTDVEFPDDKLVLLNLSVTSPTPARRIMDSYMEYNQFIINNPGYTSVTSRAVATSDWTDFGDGMRLSAPASADTTVLCEYIRIPDFLVGDDDENEMDPTDMYSEMFILGGRIRAMERNEDYEEATEERKKLVGRVVAGVYRPGLEDTFIKNEGRGRLKVGPTIMKTNRGRRMGGYRADRDF
jgi:hypothetical protein